MILWIDGTDLRDALARAEFTEFPDEKVLNRAAFTASIAAQAVIAQTLSPPLHVLDAHATALGGIERGCRESVEAVLRRLPTLPSHTGRRQALRDHLEKSMDPVIFAIRDAAASDGVPGPSVLASMTTAAGRSGGEAEAHAGRMSPHSQGADRLADALMYVGQVGDWAAVAREQYEAGRKRETTTRDQEGSLSRAFAYKLIETYKKVSGRRLKFSRGDGERPAGPLIDYLVLLFERVRGKLEADPAQALVAKERDWSPSLETLALWITLYREAHPAEAQASRQTARL